MAFNIQSLASKVRGSLLGVTFYEMQSQQIVRFNKKTCKNPRTSIQQANRSSMLDLIKLYRQVKPVLYSSLNSRPQNRLVYSQFISQNLNQSIINGTIYPNLLKFSAEDFDYTEFTVSILDSVSGELLLEWDNSVNSSKLSSDKLIICAYEPISKSIQYLISDYVRSDAFGQFTYDNSSAELSIYLYLFFVRSDFSLSSIAHVINYVFPAAIVYTAVNFGLLYNHYAVTDSRFCPAGWHVPTSSELDALSSFLGGSSVAGSHLKEIGTTHWNAPNSGALDSYLFSLTGSGYRNQNGSFNLLKSRGYLSCSNLASSTSKFIFYSDYNSNLFTRASLPFRSALSVRFIKDDAIDCGYMRDYNGNYYKTTIINGIVLTAQNYIGTLFSDLTEIPYISANVDWNVTLSPARCAYQNNLSYI